MILTYVLTGAVILASLIIQSHSSFDALRIAGVKPDLVFIMIVYSSYSFGSFYGEVTGFASGLFHDAVSSSPLGLLTFPKVILGFVIGYFNRSVLKDNVLTVSAMVFLASLAKGVITMILTFIFLEGSISSVINVIIPESFYNAILAPPLFILYDKIFER